jgi:hypothetical protein
MNEASTNSSSPAAPEIGVPPVIPTQAPFAKLRWLWLGLGLLAVVLLALLFAFDPANHSFYPFCAFYRVTGWQCPGCGGLRAAHQLLHGHISKAFQYNQLLVLAAPVVLVLGVRRLVRGPRQPQSHRAMARWAWLSFAVLVVFWVVRNLPLEIFRPPA